MAKTKQNCHFTSLLSVCCVFILGSTIIPFQLILFVRVGHEQAMRGKKKNEYTPIEQLTAFDFHFSV